MGEHNKYLQLVFNVIKKNASKDKPICAAEIQRKLMDTGNCDDCDRKTIERALERLRQRYGTDSDGAWIDDEIRLHYIVWSRSTSPIYKNYWMEVTAEDEITEDELMYLIDAVQYSKHISSKYADDLIRKLKKAINNSFDKKFSNYRILSSYDRTVKKDFFLNIGNINRAINEQKRVTFTDNEYGLDKRLHPKAGGPIIVDPYRIVVVDGNYYLLCTKPASAAVKSYRIDRMTKVEMTDEDSTVDEAVKKILSNPSEYIIEHRYMNSGKVVEVTLLADDSIIGDLIDSFGTGIRISTYADNSERIVVRVKSGEKDIVDWAIRFGGSVEIVSPLYLRDEIESRILRLSRTYSNRGDVEVDYTRAVKEAERRHFLHLRNIDLNRFDSYRNIEGVTRIHLQNNHITDFSFLENYPGIKELLIANNRINDPYAISNLERLSVLGLENTGITDLNFLDGLGQLATLALHEYTLENIEAIYSLPNLRRLTVNKMTADLIDKKRLKRVYGDGFRFSVSDAPILRMMMDARGGLPADEPARLERFNPATSGFTTFKVEDQTVKELLCSHMYADERYYEMRNGEIIYSVIEGSCTQTDRVELLRNRSFFAGDEFTCYVTYKGELPDPLTNLDLKKVFYISAFRNDHGLKLAAMARRDSLRRPSEERAERERYWDDENKACVTHIRFLLDNRICWMEISDNMEFIFRRTCTLSDVIDPNEIRNHHIFHWIDIDGDDYHYFRYDKDGVHIVRQIAYGHIGD